MGLGVTHGEVIVALLQRLALEYVEGSFHGLHLFHELYLGMDSKVLFVGIEHGVFLQPLALDPRFHTEVAVGSIDGIATLLHKAQGHLL